jgi:hypothetical protein
MNAATIASCDGIWLHTQNYRVVGLDPRLDPCELTAAVTRGTRAYPDPRRCDFYDVELDSGWAYVHVCDDLRTVYLVSYLSSNFEGPNAQH